MERRLAEEIAARQRSEEDLADAVREAAEAKAQLEDDVDTEVRKISERVFTVSILTYHKVSSLSSLFLFYSTATGGGAARVL